MKRSKIFLGATASILAVAGFAATKAYKFTSQYWYITTGTDKICAPVQSSCTDRTTPCTTGDALGNLTVYTSGFNTTTDPNVVAHNCTKVLHKSL